MARAPRPARAPPRMFASGFFPLRVGRESRGKIVDGVFHRIERPQRVPGSPTSNDLYLVGEQGLILRSTDGGQHFSAQSSPYVGTWFGALATAKGLLLYGLRGNAFLLPSNGEGWQAMQTNTTAAISGATELADGRLLLAGQSGQLLLEQDAKNFSPLAMRSSTPLTAVIEDGKQGLAVTSLRGVLNTPIASSNN